MVDELFETLNERMEKTIESFNNELGKLRTGRANAQLLDHIKVDAYGSKMPLSQVASVNVEGARGLVVSPYDRSVVVHCEKAIRASDLGLNPSVHGDTIRINLPPLTEERRKDMLKLVKEIAENSKVSIRNHRRHALGQLKILLKDKAITEDEEKRFEVKVNQSTEKFVDRIAQIATKKEQELMSV